jgi:hypothetical protein
MSDRKGDSMRKALKLTLALAALAAAGTGMLSPKRAEAACFRYCCPDAPSRCTTCCSPKCDLNCP